MKSKHERVRVVRALLEDPVALEMMRVGPRLEEALRTVTEAAEAELDAPVVELTPLLKALLVPCPTCQAAVGVECKWTGVDIKLVNDVWVHPDRLAAAPSHVKLVPYVPRCRWCAQPMAERRVCEKAPPDYDEACERVPNLCQPEEG